MSIIEKALAKKKQRAAEASVDNQHEPGQTADTNSAINTDINASTLNASSPVSQPIQAVADTTTSAAKAKSASDSTAVVNKAHDSSELQNLSLDLHDLKQRGYLVDSNERSKTHEEFRFVKRRVLKTAFGPLKDTLTHSNLVLVTSTLSNEGKTFTAINLALSIAMEQEKTVLLVDADVLNPSICNALGVQVKAGLIDYLLGKTSSLQEIIYNTNIPNLRLMPAGRKHHLTSELLASERMESLANELAERYSDRVIIFDAPPLLGINETQALTSFVGQQLVVVEENKTPLHSLESAISLLNQDRAIGLVLNKSVQTTNLYAGYGYQYAENQ
ncbi:XrtA-associated tyrosine autokinase [Motilimonas cestriensis]|uniref:non-specific protein-tyrosine kinase n=1 Tax=Motilimonas cestriensis TaxID=2742685 RepID=A0ABS8W9E9_9GAMM|nr:XrtA-associated tyrosine autokinase [Motilimonas cestriensis]MCE2594191.1 XrtA-associated tyrosine autokinase [Motilimonas cestriensis]